MTSLSRMQPINYGEHTDAKQRNHVPPLRGNWLETEIQDIPFTMI
jgi:hypothetical protein